MLQTFEYDHEKKYKNFKKRKNKKNKMDNFF